jgi:hypothetical protein
MENRQPISRIVWRTLACVLLLVVVAGLGAFLGAKYAYREMALKASGKSLSVCAAIPGLHPKTPAVPAAENEAAEVPEVYGPGEEVAETAALAGRETWTAAVQTHSGDWTTATVRVGSPGGEVDVRTLRWDDRDKCYQPVADK